MSRIINFIKVMLVIKYFRICVLHLVCRFLNCISYFSNFIFYFIFKVYFIYVVFYSIFIFIVFFIFILIILGLRPKPKNSFCKPILVHQVGPRSRPKTHQFRPTSTTRPHHVWAQNRPFFACLAH